MRARELRGGRPSELWGLDIGGFSNQARGADASDNGKIGIYVGCSPTGPGRAKCSPLSPFNEITDLSAKNHDKLGVAVDTGNTTNVINGLGAHRNSTDDLFDGNADWR